MKKLILLAAIVATLASCTDPVIDGAQWEDLGTSGVQYQRRGGMVYLRGENIGGDSLAGRLPGYCQPYASATVPGGDSVEIYIDGATGNVSDNGAAFGVVVSYKDVRFPAAN